MTPDRNPEITPALPDLAPSQEKPASPVVVSGASAGVPDHLHEQACVGDDFLSDFLGEDPDGAPVTYASLETLTQALDQAAPTRPNLSVDIQPLQASRHLQQILPLNDAREALVLAAMPHYDLGGKGGVRMGQLELRTLIAEAEATLKEGSQNVVETIKHSIRENGERMDSVVHSAADPRDIADAAIKGLVDSGYIREIHLEPAECASIRAINDVIREDLNASWKTLDADINPVVAYELTDTGIEAGRNVRNWDGLTQDAGLVRLPNAAPMPRLVASEAYAIAAMVMENRALAGTLKPGELGAFLKAELASIEYGHSQGADPQFTAGRLDGVADFARVAALTQIQNGLTGPNSPLKMEDMALITERGRDLLMSIPEEVTQFDTDDLGVAQSYTGSIDKWASYSNLAHLDGVRLGCEAINYRLEREGKADMRAPEAWKNAVNVIPDKHRPSEESNTVAMVDALKVMRGWMNQVSAKGSAIRDECKAFAEGAFGAQGAALASHMFARG